MRLEGSTGSIEFTFEHAELERYPSLAFSIQISGSGFSGRVKDVGFRVSDLGDFLRQLETLERQRQGQAELLNLSSESEDSPFRFKVFSTNKLGHIAIIAEISRFTDYHYMTASKVSIVLDIDPSTLSTLLADFKTLFEQPQG